MLLAVFFCSYVTNGQAQGALAERNAMPMFVNDDWERYARVLQLSGDVPLYPWSSRGFGPRELEHLRPTSDTHPWTSVATGKERRGKRYSLVTLPVRAQAIFNSGFPFGYNDGPVWAGRGLTTAIEAGVAAKSGPLSVTIAPVFFRADNGRFALGPNGQPGDYQYADAFIASIDQPQRFGDRDYERLDPGNSTIRLDVGPAAIGFSTASVHWGPARDHPILLGNNAGGFPHYFVGSSEPIDLWFAKVHGRLSWGRLSQSDYSPMREVQPHRFVTGLVGVIVPRGVPGLEIGGGRFFHILWSDSVLTRSNVTRTLSGILKTSRATSSNPTGSEPDNQLASVFFRWVLPTSGFEVYGEYGREDHNQNMRDLLSEPDQNSGYMLGMQRVWAKSARRRVIRAELLNTRIPGLHLAREQTQFYIHTPVAQGHTSQGQVLGSIGGFGGGASVLGFDSYSRDGRWTVSWSRIMRAENRSLPSGMPNVEEADVMHALSIDALRFRGNFAISYELTGVWELNRDFGDDAFNVRAASGVRYVW